MDRATLLQHLAMTERHVSAGEITLARQEALIAQMERHGHDTADARSVLSTMMQTQRLHTADRDRLLRELEG